MGRISDSSGLCESGLIRGKADLAGLDIGWAMRNQLSSSEKSESRYVDIADKICEMKRFGRKTGRGYYIYADGKSAQRDEWVEQLIETESARKGIVRRSFTEAEIMSAILERLVDHQTIVGDGRQHCGAICGGVHSG